MIMNVCKRVFSYREFLKCLFLWDLLINILILIKYSCLFMYVFLFFYILLSYFCMFCMFWFNNCCFNCVYYDSSKCLLNMLEFWIKR